MNSAEMSALEDDSSKNPPKIVFCFPLSMMDGLFHYFMKSKIKTPIWGGLTRVAS